MTDKLPKWILDRLIRDTTDLLTISKDGAARLTNELEVIYNDYVNFLYSILLDKKLDPSPCATRIRSKLKEKKLLFGGDTGEPLLGRNLIDVFADLKGNESSYEDFQKAFYAAIKDCEKMHPYSIAYPLNIKLNGRIERQIRGQDKKKKTFKIVNFDEFRTYFDVGKILNDEFGDLLKKAINKKYYFFVLEDVYAGNIAFAENYCKNILQTVLGLLVFSEYYQSISLKDHWAIPARSYLQVYPPTRISNISLNNALIFESGKFLTARLFNENGFELPSDCEEFKRLAREDLYIFDKALTKYNKTTGKIAEMLRNALVSYYEASIDKDLASSYLKYWICIEFCLLKTKDDRESTMAEMVGKLPFWNAKDDAPKFVKYDAYKARLLSHKRNNYVHELKTNVSQYDRYFAKKIAGDLVEYLLLSADKFTNVDELRLHYRLIAESEQDLDRASNEVTQYQKAMQPSLYSFREE